MTDASKAPLPASAKATAVTVAIVPGANGAASQVFYVPLSSTEGVDDANLATVAKTGSYHDLSDTPVIPAAPDLSPYAKTSALAPVAKSGSYADLANKPAIPAAPDLTPYAETAALAPVATSGSYHDLADKPVIPVVLTVGRTTATGRTVLFDASAPAVPDPSGITLAGLLARIVALEAAVGTGGTEALLSPIDGQPLLSPIDGQPLIGDKS